MPRKAKKEPVKGFKVFQCQLCADRPEFTPVEFSTHLTEAHQMDPKAKYQKQMSMHMDATDWYQSDYTWLHDGTVFAVQSVRLPRNPNDMMYWADTE